MRVVVVLKLAERSWNSSLDASKAMKAEREQASAEVHANVRELREDMPSL